MEANPRTVLMADDDPQALDLLIEYLEGAGYLVVPARDGCGTWERLARGERDYDVLVLDRDMPCLDGMELLSRIRSDERPHDIPVVFQSGLIDKHDMIEGIEADVFYYLAKPYAKETLLAVLCSTIGHQNRNRSLRTAVTGDARSIETMVSGHFRYRTLDQARHLACVLANAFPRPNAVVSGLLELMVNAVEHGNLAIGYQTKTALLECGEWRAEIDHRLRLPEYRDRHVDMLVQRSDTEIIVEIADKGDGFDPAPFLEIDAARAAHIHGRGIALANAMSFDEIEFRGGGTTAIGKICI
ncbi:MAG: response regulator [Gammaproteobacteria bacterium]|nr:response regulator [Gammaproteobacteria bacterium]NIY31248.1 response regulator [Gammaproteobacteria bacterium]